MTPLREFFVNLKTGTEYLNYGRDIIRDWGATHAMECVTRDPHIVAYDIGCGHGTDLINVINEGDVRAANNGKLIQWSLAGIESFPEYQKECKSLGIKTYSIDLERDEFPGKTGSVDILIANQVL